MDTKTTTIKEVKDFFQPLLPFMGNNDPRQQLNGVWLLPKDYYNNDKPLRVSCNGHSLQMIEVPFDVPNALFYSREDIKEFLKIRTKDNIEFNGEEFTWKDKILKGRQTITSDKPYNPDKVCFVLPDISFIIPNPVTREENGFKLNLTLDKNLKQVLKILSSSMWKQSLGINYCRLSISDKVELSLESHFDYDYDITATALPSFTIKDNNEWNGEPFEIGINPKYLLDALENCGLYYPEMTFDEPLDPVVVNGHKTTTLIMPVRLENK